MEGLGLLGSIALKSTSWGLFQIMGRDSREQLEAFCRFVERNSFKGKELVQYLREHDWAGFAEGYNGSGYRKNRYDERLAEVWRRVG